MKKHNEEKFTMTVSRSAQIAIIICAVGCFLAALVLWLLGEPPITFLTLSAFGIILSLGGIYNWSVIKACENSANSGRIE